MNEDVEPYLTPGSASDLISSAQTGEGTAAQQAFAAEYSFTGIKTNLVPIFVQAPSGNNAGVTDPVGGSSSQTTSAPIQADGNIASSSNIGYNQGTGWWIGYDQGVPKFFIGNSTGDSITWDGMTMTVTGDLVAGSIDIPNTTSTDSFHTDDMGNSWWGANVATGYQGAPASITNTGAAVFQSIQIGGTTQQYTVNNGGIINFGDGSDGTVTMTTGTYTLSRDMYYQTLIIDSGVTLFPNGYRTFCSESLVNNGTISRTGGVGLNGSAGTSSTGGAGGAGGTALADGYLKGAPAGATGATGTNGNSVAGNNGTATSNSLGSSGANGGNATGFNGTVQNGGMGGTATASNVKLIANWHLLTLLDISSTGSTVKFNNSASSGSGAGGGLNSPGGYTYGGGGGGGGTPGGIIAIYAKNLTLNTGSLITVAGGGGGAGGAGGGGGSPGGCGGGGGGGGNGGIIILVYNEITNNGTLTYSGGNGGSGGAGTNGGSSGGSGSNGVSGSVYQFAVSL